MHHSEAKFHTAVFFFFFSRSNIWLYVFFPLGDSAAVDVAGCLACFTAVGPHPKYLRHKLQLCNIWLHPSTSPRPPCPFTWGRPPRNPGKTLKNMGWCQHSGPWPLVAIRSKTTPCRDQCSVTMFNGLRKRLNSLVRQDLGGNMSFCSQGRWKEKSFWRVGPFLSVRPKIKNEEKSL